jgi:hypothetical protein
LSITAAKMEQIFASSKMYSVSIATALLSDKHKFDRVLREAFKSLNHAFQRDVDYISSYPCVHYPPGESKGMELLQIYDVIHLECDPNHYIEFNNPAKVDTSEIQILYNDPENESLSKFQSAENLEAMQVGRFVLDGDMEEEMFPTFWRREGLDPDDPTVQIALPMIADATIWNFRESDPYFQTANARLISNYPLNMIEECLANKKLRDRKKELKSLNKLPKGMAKFSKVSKTKRTKFDVSGLVMDVKITALPMTQEDLNAVFKQKNRGVPVKQQQQAKEHSRFEFGRPMNMDDFMNE